MALNKYKIGQLIDQIQDINDELLYGEEDVKGMTITKEIIPTKADTSNADLKKYIIVRPNEFVYNPRTHGKKIGLGFNNTQKAIIISWNNIGFRIKKEKLNTLDPYYLFINFNRNEWDREACYQSWGSSTEIFTWNAFCDMEIELPSMEIQRKYVAIYKSMLENQKNYENGLEDLKLTCDAFIEDIRRKNKCIEIEPYIQRYDEKNKDNKVKTVKGVSVTKELRDPTAKVNKNELSGYKIVHSGDITFVQTTHNEKVFANAINNMKEDIVVTSVNEVFRTKKEKLIPEYLTLFFNRREFDRYARYHSWGSARETFTWSDLIKVRIPIPDIQIQKNIVNVYKTYTLRKEINEKLKEQIKNICPILIKGSLEEAKSN